MVDAYGTAVVGVCGECGSPRFEGEPEWTLCPSCRAIECDGCGRAIVGDDEYGGELAHTKEQLCAACWDRNVEGLRAGGCSDEEPVAMDLIDEPPEDPETIGEWYLSGADGSFAVVLDQEDVGGVYQYPRGWLALCGDEDRGVFRTRGEAVAAVKRAVVQYRAQCAACGKPTTEADRRRAGTEPGFEGTEVVCAGCLREAKGGER